MREMKKPDFGAFAIERLAQHLQRELLDNVPVMHGFLRCWYSRTEDENFGGRCSESRGRGSVVACITT